MTMAAYRKTDLLAAIAGSEGRVLACETIGLTPPLLVDVTNAEYAASLRCGHSAFEYV